MKQKLTFFQKVKVLALWWIKYRDFGLMASCDHCKSPRINKVESSTETLNETQISYQAKYQCMDCHATATVNEVWTKD